MIAKEIRIRHIESRADAREAVDLISAFAFSKDMSKTERTKLVTAASELLTNMLRYGGSGTVRIEVLDRDGRSAVRLTFEDDGPGIADVDKAMTEGFSTGGSMGRGLSFARTLVDEFEIESSQGRGTVATILKWC